jgi:SAM-dependent methyltransferase
MADLLYLNTLRQREIEHLLPLLPGGARVLEFGAGTGQQARFLRDRGFDVVAIDLASSNYAKERLFPVQDYDGEHIPIEDKSIDVIFSSNVLEHVENPGAVFAEFRRIQRSGGFGLHVVPTPAWRLWTFATGLAKSLQAIATLPIELVRAPKGQKRSDVFYRGVRKAASGFVPRGHGTSIEGLSELWTFSRTAWRRKFRKYGFEVIEDHPMGLFYTGTPLLGSGISLATRSRLSRLLGSGAHMYKVIPGRADD